jgi:alpha-amylase/alpha-mannosidase (GH57 family)
MSNRNFCIHGHFYQPPREDAISGKIPAEKELSPYHNWNEKIHAECYKPNADLGNFERISFNIGPTLFHWMESYDPVTYQSIIEQENRNYRKYGIGNAIAQPYNHAILPLAEYRDKLTQVRWGIADFQHRFGHTPDGMWLPETAVDEETLEVLADCGIKFTILAPWQTYKKNLDTTQPYRVDLVGGKSIVVFFYQMDISTRISFDPGATSNADRFLVEHLLPAYTSNKKEELIMAASDGELYGHHQKFRDKFLQRLIRGPVLDGKVQYTFPGLFLQQHPARLTSKIVPGTSWSCHHGISRWMEDCGCTPGSNWKAPLRNALNEIGLMINQCYYSEISMITADPWSLRDEYIHVMLGKMSIIDFGKRSIQKELTPQENRWLKALMESQVARQKMFTSCGWFFDELYRIEPRNNIGYAAQAILLIEIATKKEMANQAAELLKNVASTRFNINGRTIFQEYYQRAKKNLPDYFNEFSLS